MLESLEDIQNPFLFLGKIQTEELASPELSKTRPICIILELGKKNVDIFALEMQRTLVAWVGHGTWIGHDGIRDRRDDFGYDEVAEENK